MMPTSSEADHPGLGRCDVLICTGIGRLHLIDTAVAVARAGFTVGLVTGWAPRSSQQGFVDWVGRMLRQPRLYERLAARRRVLAEAGCQLFESPLAEAASTLAWKLHLGENDRLSACLWRLCGWEARRYLRKGKILHVRSGAGAGGAVGQARRLGMRIVADHSIAHPTVVWRNLQNFGAGRAATEPFNPSSRFWGIVLADCAAADLILVNSHFVRETMIEQGFALEKIRVAYLGVDEFFHAAKRHHREVRDTPVRALFAGHFEPRKGSHVLLAAVRELGASGIAVELHVAGQVHDGPVEAARAGVEDKVRFHGLLGREALRELMASCDVFVFPTLAEGCSKAAMEALGAGLPVITTRACGLPREADPFVTEVPLGDAVALARAVAGLGADRERRARCGEAGATLVSTRFRPSDYADAVGAIYRELLASPVASRS